MLEGMLGGLFTLIIIGLLLWLVKALLDALGEPWSH